MPRDLAKIAYLYLTNGVWEGKAIVPADWVKASITPRVAVSDAGVQYGYILPDKPTLTPRVAIDRVLEAVVNDHSGSLR